MKKIILILIDSLMADHLEKAKESNNVPALQYLIDNGIYNNQCVTVFPSMTAPIDASLLTGVYPNQHKIPGLIWYSSKEKRLINYMNGSNTVLKLGINSTIRDLLININELHLSKQIKTIYEELSDNKKTAASINFIVHRGREKHQSDLPFLINLFTKFSLNKVKISGPDFLSKGTLFKPKIRFRQIKWTFNQSIFKKYGNNDSFSTDIVEAIIIGDSQPDLMMVYLPNHDHYLHKNIDNPIPSLEKVDEQISRVLNTYGSWKEALDKNIFIIIGDHGQTKIGKENTYNIDLNLILKKYKLLKIGKKVTEKEEIVIANNERMAYVYPLKEKLQKSVQNDLLFDDRIDFVAWKHGKKVRVENHQKKVFTFGRNGEYIDQYGMNWNMEGDYDLLDIKIKEHNKISYYAYPDALSRLYGALFAQEDYVIIVNAKPSYEFFSKTFQKHLGGGSHGSLHRTDSIVPFIVAGTDKKPNPDLRIIDIKEYLLKLLEVSTTT
ncbi:MAG: alkaline phosphatase family protein [Vulcanibacillus sp.]